MLETAISRIAGFSSFPVVFLLLGASGLLLLRLFPVLGEVLAGIAEAVTGLLRSLRWGLGPLGLLLLPLEILWNLLRKLLTLLWALLQKILDWILAFLRWLFGLDLFDGCGCGCAPLGCLMIPFVLLAKLFGLGDDDNDSGGGGSSYTAPQRQPASSPQHAHEPAAARARGAREDRREHDTGGISLPIAEGVSRAGQAATGAVSGAAGAVRRRTRSSGANTQRSRRTAPQRTIRMVGKSASIPKQNARQSRVSDAVSGAVGSAKEAVAGAASEVTENVKAAVGASTDPEYFGDVPERAAFASAWTIHNVEDARDIAEILAERDIPHSWQIDETTGLPTVTIPNYAAGRATGALGEHGFDVGEGMPADFVSVDRIHEAPGAGTVYDPETGEWVTPEPEWDGDGETPALEERAVYDPDAGAMYDPVTDSHYDEEIQGWYDAAGEPVTPDAEYADVDVVGAGEETAQGERPALPPPSDEADFYWGPHPEPVPARREVGQQEAGEVVDAPHVEDVPHGGDS